MKKKSRKSVEVSFEGQKMVEGAEMTLIEKIQAMKAQADAATKGPWTVMDCPPPSFADHGWRAITKLSDKRMVAATKEAFLRIDEKGTVRRTKENNTTDLAFIAASRTNVPKLCDALEAAINYISVGGYFPNNKCDCAECERQNKILSSIAEILEKK